MSAIDCDVHAVVGSSERLLPYLDNHWAGYLREAGFTGGEAVVTSYPPGAPTSGPPDAGRTLADVQANVLDGGTTEIAILNCYFGLEQPRHPDFVAALARAVNDWQIEEWLTKDPRVRASIAVGGDVEAIVREIERVGDHPGFVQVLLPARSERPYGHRSQFPIFEAAVRHELAVAIHFGGVSGNAPTASGWPSLYLEEYAGMATVYQSQVMSIVSEGVLSRFPALRIVLAEAGFAWLPAWMWRLDKEWRGLRREVPWVKRPPSAYIREHMRATIQPIDAPPTAEQLHQVLEQLGSDEFLLYASDYPHRHEVDETALSSAGTFLDALPDELRAKVLRENALAFYRGLV